MSKLVGLLIDPRKKSDEQETVTIGDKDNLDQLNEIKEIIGCDYIDIVTRRIGSKMFCIVCDDEGALKDGNFITSQIPDNSEKIYGRIIIFNRGSEDIESLNDGDIDTIKEKIKPMHFVYEDRIIQGSRLIHNWR